jgi:site-specific DNA recombinase
VIPLSSLLERGKRTAIYVRVSTTKQSQKDSPEHQEGICREKSRQMNLDVIDELIYEDRDSGTNIVGRPAIQQLIADAQKARFDNVVFASLSRFSRDTMDSLTLKRILVDTLGIRLISLDEGYDSYMDKDELKFQIISAVNQKLSEQISISSKRGIRQSALKGNFIGSIAPYGYKKARNGQLKALIPDDETKEYAQLIYKLYTSDKMGEKQIAVFLNTELCIPSPKGGVWGVSSIQRILQNEAYTGVNVFGKYESKIKYRDIHDLSDRKKMLLQRDKNEWERPLQPQTHEALIDKEVFDLAQQIRLQRGGGKRGGIRNKKNVFAGFIKCAHCDTAMVSMRVKSSKIGREYRYLICSAHRRQGNAGCENNYWLPYHPFKEDIITSISENIEHSASVETLFDKHKELLSLDSTENHKKTKTYEKQIEHNRHLLFELRKEKMLGALSQQQYEYEKQIYETEIYQLEKKTEVNHANIDKYNHLQELVEEVKEALDDLINLNYDYEEDFDEFRMILMKLIEKITVSSDGQVNVKMTFGIELIENE